MTFCNLFSGGLLKSWSEAHALRSTKVCLPNQVLRGYYLHSPILDIGENISPQITFARHAFIVTVTDNGIIGSIIGVPQLSLANVAHPSLVIETG